MAVNVRSLFPVRLIASGLASGIDAVAGLLGVRNQLALRQIREETLTVTAVSPNYTWSNWYPRGGGVMLNFWAKNTGGTVNVTAVAWHWSNVADGSDLVRGQGQTFTIAPGKSALLIPFWRNWYNHYPNHRIYAPYCFRGWRIGFRVALPAGTTVKVQWMETGF